VTLNLGLRPVSATICMTLGKLLNLQNPKDKEKLLKVLSKNIKPEEKDYP
jgi:hypothetical protein